MRLTKKCVLFDLDGTLLNTSLDLCNAVNHALLKSGLEKLPNDIIIKYTGNGIRRLCELAVGDRLDLFDEVFLEFKSYYDIHCLDVTYVYDGIVDLIKELKKNGIKTAVISNKADKFVKLIIDRYFEKGSFDFVTGGVDNIPLKPNREIIDYVLNVLDEKIEDSVYIGDSEVDIATSKNTGMDSIIVSYGFRDKEYLLKIDENAHIVDSVKELKESLI